MKLLQKIKNKFWPQPKLGPEIFFQRTWLTKQVDDAIYRAQFERHAPSLGGVKQQTKQ